MAIASPLLLGCIATAVDYSRMSRTHSGLIEAADAAVLAGVKIAAEAHAKGDKDWKTQGKKVARKMFTASILKEEYSDAAFKVEFDFTDGVINGTAEFDKTLEMAFAKILGFPKSRIVDSVGAAIGSGKYVDIAFLLDNSMSMGIAATPDDQRKLYNATYNSADGVGCAFACHTPKNDFEKPLSVENAHSLGIKLRIDVVAESVANAVEILKNNTDKDHVRVAVYTFSNSLEEFIAPTTNLSDVQTKLKNLDLVKYRDGGPTNVGGTYIRTALNDLKKKLNDVGIAGDGSQKTKRQSYVVLMSDGLEHNQSNVPAGYFSDGSRYFASQHTELDGWKTEKDALVEGAEIMQMFDSSSCNELKYDNRHVYTGQVRYTIATNFDDQSWNIPKVKYITDNEKNIENAFATCASDSSDHFIAETSEEIDPMMQNIVDAIMESTTSRLTN